MFSKNSGAVRRILYRLREDYPESMRSIEEAQYRTQDLEVVLTRITPPQEDE